MQSELTGAAATDSRRHKQIQALRGANNTGQWTLVLSNKVEIISSAQLIDDLFFLPEGDNNLASLASGWTLQAWLRRSNEANLYQSFPWFLNNS